MVENVDWNEIAPDIYRIEAIRDNKRFGLHALCSKAQLVLVDAGYERAPIEMYQPFLRARGKDLADVDIVLITHADVDHHGGTHRIQSSAPHAVVAAHASDTSLVESSEELFADRYRRFESRHGIGYDDETIANLHEQLGPDPTVTLRLRGGESLRVGSRSVEVLHAPGHSRGHLVLADEENDVVLGADGCFADGLRDVDGTPLQPPPYYDAASYRRTIQLLETLDPDRLSFTHYPLLERAEVRAFLDASRAYVETFETFVRTLLREEGPVTMAAAVDAAVDRFGDAGRNLDYTIPFAAHVDELVDAGEVVETSKENCVAWDLR